LAVYAIVRTGGKQYRVQQGATIDVERLAAPEGGRVELPDVLLLDEDGRVTVGTPTVPGVKVVAEVVSHGRGPKLIVFKYKAKTRYRKKTGHRQAFTRLAIQRIQVGEEEEKPAPRRRARKAAAAEPAVAEAAAEPAVAEAAAEPAVAEAAAEPTVAEAAAEEPAVVSEAAAPEEQVEKKPAPRRRRKTAETPPTGE
jgi:large subunit ribosomal protein L21